MGPARRLRARRRPFPAGHRLIQVLTDGDARDFQLTGDGPLRPQARHQTLRWSIFRAALTSRCRPNAKPKSVVSKSHDVRDVGTGTNRAVSDKGFQARPGEVFRPKPTLCHQILGRLLHDRVPQAPVPFASRRNGGFSKDGQQSHPRLRNERPHFVENALLVVHRAPSVRHADGEIKLRPDRKAGGVPGHDAQPALVRRRLRSMVRWRPVPHPTSIIDIPWTMMSSSRSISACKNARISGGASLDQALDSTSRPRRLARWTLIQSILEARSRKGPSTGEFMPREMHSTGPLSPRAGLEGSWRERQRQIKVAVRSETQPDHGGARHRAHLPSPTQWTQKKPIR
jgi:hypothetical protein